MSHLSNVHRHDINIDKLILSIFNNICDLYKYQNKRILKGDIDININLDLNKSITDKELIDEFIKILNNSVNTTSILFMNQLYTGSDQYTALAELFTCVLNTSMYIYEVGPVFNDMEKEVFRHINTYLSYNNIITDYDIITTPGGSFANMIALHLARYSHDKNINKIGGHKYSYEIYISNQAHYSFEKSAMILGMGKVSVIKVPSLKNGKMNIKILENYLKSSQKNNNRFSKYKKYKKSSSKTITIIVGTAGTTVYGAIDDLEELNILSKKYNTWYHIDASFGGTIMMSNTHRYKLSGMNHADSITWNAHKMLGIPLQCTLLMVRNNSLLSECFSLNADYLFKQESKNMDTGDKYLQCGRRNDILKLWTYLKVHDKQIINDDIDHLFNMTYAFINLLRKTNKFNIIIEEPETPIICFNYKNDLINEYLDTIRNDLVKNNELMVSYQYDKKYGYFYRLPMINKNIDIDDLNDIVNVLLKPVP